MKDMNSEVGVKELTTFIKDVMELEPLEFMGILKIMSVEPRLEAKTPRPFEELLEDLIDRFCGLERKRRREVSKLVRLTVKKTKEEKKKQQKLEQKQQKQNALNAAIPSEVGNDNTIPLDSLAAATNQSNKIV